MSHHLSQKKPFLAAARDGDLNTVIRLLDEGVPVDVYSRNKSTALIRAGGEGHEQIVNLLLDRGADIKTCNEVGETALTRAAEKGRLSMVAVLLAAGATVDGCSRHSFVGWDTPLEQALLNDHLAVANLLCQHGADPNLAMGTLVWKQRLDLVDILLKMGADVNEVTSYGRTPPLMRAAFGGNSEMVLALIARGADPNLCSQSKTALGQALRFGNASVVEALIQSGARCQFVNEAMGIEDYEGVRRLL